MKSSKYLFSILLSLLSAFLVLIGTAYSYEHSWDNYSDATKIQGPEACIECHANTGKVWEGMMHSKTFRLMPRSDRAREIADNLGIARIKTDPLCLSCHFTTQVTDSGRSKPIAGISCESCHNAGKDWIDVHNNFGEGMTEETETEDHKTKRIQMSEDAGMIRPARLFDWASNCYSCHTVPQEKLVNVGGHPAGSKFELVAWSQGEVRHNVWFSADNNEASMNKKRLMYVTGRLLDLAYALRGVSQATEKAEYSVSMAKRAKAAMLHLGKVQELQAIPVVAEALDVANGVELKLNNEGALTKAANQVAAMAQKFAAGSDGSDLAGIDSLLPSSDRYKGTPAG